MQLPLHDDMSFAAALLGAFQPAVGWIKMYISNVYATCMHPILSFIFWLERTLQDFGLLPFHA